MLGNMVGDGRGVPVGVQVGVTVAVGVTLAVGGRASNVCNTYVAASSCAEGRHAAIQSIQVQVTIGAANRRKVIRIGG